MNDDRMTNLFALRIDRFLDQQWTEMAVFNQNGAHFFNRKPKMKFGRPSVVGGMSHSKIFNIAACGSELKTSTKVNIECLDIILDSDHVANAVLIHRRS